MTTDRGVAEEGSFHWYLFTSGEFVKTVAVAIQRADSVNRESLRLGFPQMVAAFESPDWDKPPAGFAPRYDAPDPREREHG